jgi:hypothetical protein
VDENKEKNYTVEWSFSFEKLGQQIDDFFKSLGDKGDQEIKHGHFSEPLGAATSARVRVDFSVGESTVTALTTSENLLEADLTYVGEVELQATGEQEKVVHLSQSAGAGEWLRSAFGWIGSGQRLRWDIALTPKIPLNLDLHGGAGRSTLDLSGLQLTGLNVGSGAGEFLVKLPGGRYSARYAGGVGRSSISVPSGADVDLNVSSGAGEVNLDISEGAALNARISGGVGQCNVSVPANGAVRLEARTGIGSINAGARLQRVSASGGDFWDKGGVWQTANYEGAERKIVIRFDGGVGALNVR